jgi:hypothetical protein
MGSAACRANAGDQKTVAAGSEPVRHADRIAQLQDLVISELDDLVTA